MASVGNVTVGEDVRSDRTIYGILPVLPNGAIPAPMRILTVLSNNAQNVEISPNTRFVIIGSEDYGCYYRFKTPADSGNVVGTDGGNQRGYVLPNSQRTERPVSGATYISVIGASGTARVTIEQRA